MTSCNTVYNAIKGSNQDMHMQKWDKKTARGFKDSINERASETLLPKIGWTALIVLDEPLELDGSYGVRITTLQPLSRQELEAEFPGEHLYIRCNSISQITPLEQ